ncbi:nucleotidyltransferase family protein [Aliiroseovarius sp. F47248L]|uniref:nucleotidyltransferase family protein n=1 Tax=Aliiroseovarius sp. F47248L TaxID=2926420 RepID=UPI001FF11578|nr:nucleotidyltransferase family protein [Aliiroseovarius sp. F47248L]MCK0138702.1 nucleotidyltransferase family protein [Aliiroseovarius sp. F47248L]
MSQAPSLAVLIMAAGQSRRMGRDKLLLCGSDGVALLTNRIDTAIKTGHRVFVALPQHDSPRRELVSETKATPLSCPNAHLGMGHSLSEAIGMLPDEHHGVLILLADMPALTADDLCQTCAAYDPDRIIRGGTQDLAPGHPVLVPARYLDRLESLAGDQGAQSSLKGMPTRIIPLPQDHAFFDIDTEEDWQLWMDRTTP